MAWLWKAQNLHPQQFLKLSPIMSYWTSSHLCVNTSLGMTLDEVNFEGRFWQLSMQKEVFLSGLSQAWLKFDHSILHCLGLSFFLHKTAKTCNNGYVGAPCNEEAFKVEKYTFKFSNRNVGKNMHWVNYPSGWTWQSVSKKQFSTEGVPIQIISQCCSGNCPFPASSGHS